MGAWIATNWFDLLQSIAITAGLFFTGATLREQAKARRVGNLITLTQQHRDIWREYLSRPELARVRNPQADLRTGPLTLAEETFVKLVLVHLVSAYQATRLDETEALGRMSEDVGEFFSLPIPAAVWQARKSVHEQSFVDFVDQALEKASLRR